MVLKFFPNIKNLNKGITLIELVVVIFIIALFSLIVISDFPKIQKQYALSSVTYKLAQDLRRTQDLSLSGVSINDANGNAIKIKGYGIYIPSVPTTQYIIYADVNNSQTYDSDQYLYCASPQYAETNKTADCIIDIIDVAKQNSSLHISEIDNINSNYTSINFSPPGPTTTIDKIILDKSPITISLSNGLTTRTVQVNTSGLINVQ